MQEGIVVYDGGSGVQIPAILCPCTLHACAYTRCDYIRVDGGASLPDDDEDVALHLFANAAELRLALAGVLREFDRPGCVVPLSMDEAKVLRDHATPITSPVASAAQASSVAKEVQQPETAEEIITKLRTPRSGELVSLGTDKLLAKLADVVGWTAYRGTSAEDLVQLLQART